MNEFIDAKRGRMVAIPEVEGCNGCAYYDDDDNCPDVIEGRACCSSSNREDGRSIIWVRAVYAAIADNPAGVRLTDEQIAQEIASIWGAAHIAPQSAAAFARAIESAVLKANGMEK